MFLSNTAKIYYLKGAPKRAVTCARCSNLAEQPLVCWNSGMFVRFAGLHVLGKRDYGYICPVCMEVSELLTKDQAMSLRSKG
jgi:hypothetical protein